MPHEKFDINPTIEFGRKRGNFVVVFKLDSRSISIHLSGREKQDYFAFVMPYGKR